MFKREAFDQIILHPAEILEQECEPIDGVSSFSAEIAARLRKALSKSGIGIGLSAPQIGVAKRMILLRCDPRTKAGGGHVMINPVIVSQSEKMTSMTEACLSLPGKKMTIWRPESVVINYVSETGRNKQAEFSGLAAKCVQHEIDHLDGILIIDRVKFQKESKVTIPTIGAITEATLAHFSRSR